MKFKVYNLIQQEQNNQIDNCKLEIYKINSSNEEPLIGITNDQGIFMCQGAMFNKIMVKAQKKAFLNISYEFDVNAHKAGEYFQIPMIPDYYSLINQYHILIYIQIKTQHFDYFSKILMNFINPFNLEKNSLIQLYQILITTSQILI